MGAVIVPVRLWFLRALALSDGTLARSLGVLSVAWSQGVH